jgi:hypothetical protein
VNASSSPRATRASSASSGPDFRVGEGISSP